MLNLRFSVLEEGLQAQDIVGSEIMKDGWAQLNHSHASELQGTAVPFVRTPFCSIEGHLGANVATTGRMLHARRMLRCLEQKEYSVQYRVALEASASSEL